MGSPSDGVRHRLKRLARGAAHRVAEQVPGRLSRATSGMVGSDGPGEFFAEDALLSVVVPVYQVEEYLAECLDSLLNQTYERLEIVLVDDGSTDRSADIARGYAERDPRIRVVRQPNAGLGAARNAGLAHCRGELVTFADSDDTVPSDAYRRMVKTLRRTGSDFVVGALVRDEGGVERMRPWARRAHARRRLAITIDDAPVLLTNVMACTKVFRRDFVDRIGLRFPVNTRYEDQVPITRAYLQARAFDVLPTVVYRWRKRDDKSSISQQKAEMQDLLDRVAAQREAAEFLHEEASEAVLRSWYVKALRQDFFAYLRVAADADDDYWEVLQDNLVSIARQAPEDLDNELELRIRIAVWLGRRGDRTALRDFVRDEGFAGSNFPVDARDGHLEARVPSLERHGLPLPESLMRIRVVDLILTTRLESLDWSAPGRLGLQALAALSYADPSRLDVATRMTLTGPPGTTPLDVPTRAVEDPTANLVARRSYEDHTRSAVLAEVDLEALVAASGSRRSAKWELRVEAALPVGPTARASDGARIGTETSLESRRDNGSAVVPRSVLVDGALVTTRWSDRRGLVIEVLREFAAVTGVVADVDAFEIAVRAPGLSAVSQVHVGTTVVPATIVPATDPDCWTIRLSGSTPGGEPVSGRVRVAANTPDRQTLPVVGDLEPASLCQDRVCLTISNDGQLTAVPDQPVLLVDAVEVRTETIVVVGRAHRVTDGQVVLRGPRAESAPRPLDVVDETFSLELPTRHSPWGQVPSPLPANVYSLVAESAGELVQVLAGRLFHDPTPAPPTHGWSVETVPDRRLMLRRTRHADRTTASRLGQERLRSGVYAQALSRPPRDLVVFECFEGAGTGDGPRAVCDGLLESRSDLDLAWSVDDLSVAPVDGTRVVLRGTPQWYDAIGSARLVVTNSTLPGFYVKGAGQIVVQTWHGTPLKRIGTDIPHQRVSTEHHLRLLLGQAHTWDHLVSSSPFCTEIFRRAFAYDGEILEIGRPSNDMLVGPGSSAVRDQVRARLGIPEGQTVLLYAPTWRDDAWRGGTWDKVVHLDCEAVTRARPDVTVLVRGHPNTAHRPRVPESTGVVDVTAFPDFTRLLLAADVLVTDYSGAVFDFAHTDRPMIFLTPDLETYRDRVRGLYLDLEELAPGPVVRTTEEVLTCLDLEDRWSSARHHLRSTFAPLDDGAVTKRLLAAVSDRL